MAANIMLLTIIAIAIVGYIYFNIRDSHKNNTVETI